jgi:hypothetical protein
MLKVKYENDGDSPRIGSRKNFRISSPKIEAMRRRRNLDLEPGEVVNPIPEPEVAGKPGGDTKLGSRIAIENE